MLRNQIFLFFSDKCNERTDAEKPTYIAFFYYLEETTKLITKVINEVESKKSRTIDGTVDVIARITPVHLIVELSYMLKEEIGEGAEEGVCTVVFSGIILMKTVMGWMICQDHDKNNHFYQSNRMKYRKTSTEPENERGLLNHGGALAVAEIMGAKYFKYII